MKRPIASSSTGASTSASHPRTWTTWRAVEALKVKANTAVPTERSYRTTAVRIVDEMKQAVAMFNANTIEYTQELIGDFQRHDPRTVAELVVFMQKYRLQFAAADLRPQDMPLYNALYALFRKQKAAFGLKTVYRQPASPAATAAVLSKLLLHHIEVFDPEYAKKRGHERVYEPIFTDIQTRMKRLQKILEAREVPYQEIMVLAIDMKTKPIYLHMLNNAVRPQLEGKDQRAWRDYEPAVKDLEAAIKDAVASNAIPMDLSDAFQPGSVWMTDVRGGTKEPRAVLVVIERANDQFKAVFVSPEDTLRMNMLGGTIKNGRIEWRGRDVMALGKTKKGQAKQSTPIPDQSGVLDGERINMTQSGTGGSASGAYALRLKK